MPSLEFQPVSPRLVVTAPSPEELTRGRPGLERQSMVRLAEIMKFKKKRLHVDILRPRIRLLYTYLRHEHLNSERTAAETYSTSNYMVRHLKYPVHGPQNRI